MPVKAFATASTEETIKSAQAALQDHGFNVDIVDTLDEARELVLKTIPKDAEVFTATSVTLTESGLEKALNDSGKYKSVRDMFMPLYGQPDKAVEMRRIGSGSDYAVGSVHAITEDGQVVIASASGSQLPNYSYGASHVIWVAGAQKIVKDLDEALERIEQHTLPLEDERAKKAYGSGSHISKLLIYREDRARRTHLIIIREAVGF